MSEKTGQSYRERAIKHRQSGEYIEAGEYYTLVAYDRFSEGLPGTYGTRMSGGEVNLLRAAICYRLAGRMDRCQNRCRQGILIAEDLIDRVFRLDPPNNGYDRARRGVWYEYIGDFRCIGNFGDPTAAYEDAIEVYEAADDPDTWYSEQEHCYTMAVYREVAKAVDEDPGPIDDFDNDLSLSNWVERKRKTYPSLLEELAEYGEWPTD